ncbi:hypothetical protein Mapa_005713 [Marchantia paleacea]|nr:hypothetical protein Mapa_005713 [Marchantia paleacea]
MRKIRIMHLRAPASHDKDAGYELFPRRSPSHAMIRNSVFSTTPIEDGLKDGLLTANLKVTFGSAGTSKREWSNLPVLPFLSLCISCLSHTLFGPCGPKMQFSGLNLEWTAVCTEVPTLFIEVTAFTSATDRSEWKDVGKVMEMVNPLVVGFGLGCAIAWFLSLQRLQQRQFYFPLHFLVVGDWGRNGFYNQSVVASQMGQVGAKLGISFVISTGDNFYNTGLAGVDDIQFTTSFTNIYTSPSLQTRWYTGFASAIPVLCNCSLLVPLSVP